MLHRLQTTWQRQVLLRRRYFEETYEAEDRAGEIDERPVLGPSHSNQSYFYADLVWKDIPRSLDPVSARLQLVDRAFLKPLCYLLPSVDSNVCVHFCPSQR